MGDRLKSRYYSQKRIFVADMTRIFTNCRSYNGADTEYYKCANVLERFFLAKMRDAGLAEKTSVNNTASTTNTTNTTTTTITTTTTSSIWQD